MVGYRGGAVGSVGRKQKTQGGGRIQYTHIETARNVLISFYSKRNGLGPPSLIHRRVM